MQTRAQQAAEHEELAIEATRRASNITSTNPRERDASVRHYAERAEFHASMARSLRKPN
ncbi:hypothetical protein [Streptomyces sp. DB-54]